MNRHKLSLLLAVGMLALNATAISAESNSTKATVLLTEDFSKFTAGTEDAPDSENIAIVDPETGSYSVPTTYTQEPGWSGQDIYQAGGVCYLKKGDSSYFPGWINTPEKAYFAEKGTVNISFRARIFPQDEASQAEIYVWEMIGSSIGTMMDIDITNEWAEYKIGFSGTAEQNFFQFGTNGSTPFQIDDIQIEVGGIQAPTPIEPDDYNGVSFTAKWNPVNDADAYLLTVKDSNGTFILTDKEVTDTFHKVENLSGDASTTYSFSVKAKAGDDISAPSAEQEVELSMLQDVVLKPMTDASTTGFTGNWEATPLADGYITDLYLEQKFQNEGVFYFLDTDFSGINTTESFFEGYLDDYLDRASWGVSYGELEEGKLGLNNNYGSYYTPFLVSPKLDFSNDNGTATIELTVSATADMEVSIGFYTDESGKYAPIDETKLKTFKATTTPTKQTITLEGGTKDSYILVKPTDTTKGIIWFDDMSVAQQIAAGNAVEVVVPGGGETTDLKFTFKTPAATANQRYGYCVTAYYEKSYYETLFSNPSEIQYRDTMGGLLPLEANANAFVSNGILTVRNANRQTVTVFDLSGTQIAMLPDVDNATIPLPHRGVYIVKIGNRTLKVMN